MKSNPREKYSGWGRGGEKYEPAEFQGRSNRRDDYITDNSLLESLGSGSEYFLRGKTQGILHPSRPGPSGMRPSADLRVRFASPRQQRIEEEIAYHSFELNNLSKKLDTVKKAHCRDTGYKYHHNHDHNFHGYPDNKYARGENSSTLLSHDAFSVEASIDYAKPKPPSKWKRSGSPFRARGRSKSPGRGGRLSERSSDRDRSKSPRRPQESRSDRGRSPGRAVGRGRDEYYDL